MPRARRRNTAWLAALATATTLALALALFLDGAQGDDGPGPAQPLRRGDLAAQPDGPALPAPVVESPAGPPRQRVQPVAPPRRGPLHVAGRVVDAANQEPITAFQVTLLPAGAVPPLERLGEVPPVPFHTRTGVFSMPQPEGTYDVVVSAPGFLPGELRGVPVPAADGKPLPVALSRGPGIAGVLLGHDRLPRPGLPVFLETLRLADSQARPPRVSMVPSGADGGFSFSPLPDGEYAVTALSPDNRHDRVAGIRVFGAATRVELLLAPRHQVSFKVQDLRGRPVEGARVELSGPAALQSGVSSAEGVVVLDNLSDGRWTVQVEAPGHAVLREDVELSGGTGQQVRWLTLEPAPEDRG